MSLAKRDDQQQPPKAGPKKPYQKPAFRHEQVFETMALSCGKISGTQGACSNFGKKSS
jgi:hypothetical protein